MFFFDTTSTMLNRTISVRETRSRIISNSTNYLHWDNFEGPKEDYLKIGVPLYEASIKCDWEAARNILLQEPELVRYSITENGETALHIAASAKGPKHVEHFVKNLVEKMTIADLELVNKNHSTALYLAAAAGNLETVKIMVGKNKVLPQIPGAGEMLPLYAAALFGNHEVVKYLYRCSEELTDDAWNPQNRDWLLEKCIESDMFDVALDIVKKHPGLSSGSALGVLAKKTEAFSEKKSNVIGRTFKSVSAFISRKAVAAENKRDALQLLRVIWRDIVAQPKNVIDKILRGPPDPIKSGRVVQTIQLRELIFELLDKLETETKDTIQGPGQVSQLKKLVREHVVKMHVETQALFKQDNKTSPEEGDQDMELEKHISEYLVNIYDETLKEYQVRKVQKLISGHIAKMRNLTEQKETHSHRVLFVAAEMGNTNFLVELIRLCPDLIWKVNDNNQTIFHIAVKHRHEGIYNLLYEIGSMKDMITPLKDEHGNNMLHLVGKTAKQKRLEDVSGVALQMQRELLWFLEVSKMIPPSHKERKNDDGLTPHELFTKEHKELVTQGENWMKGTANQCMVVAALIATIVFAAAFTVPGGYNQNDATMTLAFGVSFFVLYQKGFLWIPILIGAFALLPVILYLCLQYGLFFDIIWSTYGSRYLFKPKKHVLYYENPKV
ncbi:ankyrin repeat-containing domain, PGG domain protein [Artemisia annua]|uniref:Ankyrin repeat-containing domain, PGG domain protein n=1 Tax=Artemisia annua TaxID=35608 RepID=A0A2U1NNY5_ARTAN|nr:ankyrin repeat-containing domain, PGG domain protein [Artemisia annua]